MRYDGRRNHPAYEASDPPRPPRLPPPPRMPLPSSGETPSFMQRSPLARTLVLVAAAATGIAGVVTATGAAVVQVINATGDANARKSNAEIDRRLEAIEVRVNGDFGLPLETKARQARDDELTSEQDKIKARLRKVESAHAEK